MSVLLERIPLVQTEAGDIFLEGSRIPLETLVDAFNSGYTPEDFVADYPHLELADVYAILSYYLRHRDKVDAYVAKQYRDSEAFRESNPYAPASLRVRIRSRRVRA